MPAGRVEVASRFTGDGLLVKDSWSACYREKWNILLLAFVVVIATTLVVFSLTPVYRASATLLIEQKTARPVSIEQVYGIEGSSSEYLYTQFELLNSRTLMEGVVRDLKLQDHADFKIEAKNDFFGRVSAWLYELSVKYNLPFLSPPGMTPKSENSEAKILAAVVRNFSAAVVVEPVRGTQLVRVSVDMSDPETAAKAADAIVNVYIESQLDAKLSMTKTAMTWLNERMGGLKEKLQESEKRLQEYLETENLVDFRGYTTVTAEELSQTGQRLSNARKAREIAESQYRQVQDGARYGDWERIASLSFVMADPLVLKYKSDVARTRGYVEELSLRYGPKHPKMKAAFSELSAARGNLREQIGRVTSGIQESYQATIVRERSLKASYDENREAIQLISRKEFKLRELQLEVEANRSLYDTFMTRFKETTATSDFEAANARLVDSAAIPAVPIKPRKKLLVVLSALAGLTLGMALTIVSEVLSTTFRDPDELESFVGVPVVGALPDTGRMKGRAMAQLYTTNKNQLFSESIRSIRTGIILSKSAAGSHVVLVASSVPGEGKSTLSSNLAQSLGVMASTILVDADMRRPSLGLGFKIQRHAPGLAQVLDGTASLADSVKQHCGVAILPAGKSPANPIELIASPSFGSLIDELKSNYDYVIIDTPPIMSVSDALIISKLADEVVYVVKADSTNARLINSGVQKLRMVSGKVSGLVLNKMDMGSKHYYYKYYG